MSMKDRRATLALEGAIRKWEDILSDGGVDEGGDNCTLCHLYGNTCEGCPVFLDVGTDGCSDSPYGYWVDHHRREHPYKHPKKVECPECARLAEEELNYLRKLSNKEED